MTLQRKYFSPDRRWALWVQLPYLIPWSSYYLLRDGPADYFEIYKLMPTVVFMGPNIGSSYYCKIKQKVKKLSFLKTQKFPIQSFVAMNSERELWLAQVAFELELHCIALHCIPKPGFGLVSLSCNCKWQIVTDRNATPLYSPSAYRSKISLSVFELNWAK